MAVTFSDSGAVVKATAEGDLIPGKKFKALFWILSGATENTDLLELTEEDTDGHQVYIDAASKTHGAVAIPCPEHSISKGLYVKDLDNGFVLAYPIK